MKLNQTTIGWVNYFGIADMRKKLLGIDEWNDACVSVLKLQIRLLHIAARTESII